jgi:rhodanese-related sulfurtransferase
MFEAADTDQVQKLIDGGAQVVEVLEPKQFRRAHLPGAVNIPAWELTPDRAGELDRNRPVVVYCDDAV